MDPRSRPSSSYGLQQQAAEQVAGVLIAVSGFLASGQSGSDGRAFHPPLAAGPLTSRLESLVSPPVFQGGRQFGS